MKTDKQIKSEATKTVKFCIYEWMVSPRDITADCSDGKWIRKLWRNPSGHFGWDKWTKC